MDYYGLFVAGKALWTAFGESRNIIFVAKKVAKPAAKFLIGTAIGIAIEDTLDNFKEKING